MNHAAKMAFEANCAVKLVPLRHGGSPQSPGPGEQ